MDDTRAAVIVKDVVETLRDVIRRHGVTYPEYRQAVAFLARAAERGELPLLFDVLMESTVDDVTGSPAGATDSNVEGPFYVRGAPEITAGDDGLTHLPMRPDEAGDRLVFTGEIRSAAGGPVGGAVLDLWQADAAGTYSAFAPGLPEWNLRGRVTTAADGRFAVHTVVPRAYDIPGEPHTARILELLDLEPHRPAHLHVKVEAAGYAPLTTQVYFEGDPWLECDVVGGARPSLVTKLEPAGGPGAYTCRFDFTLAPVGG